MANPNDTTRPCTGTANPAEHFLFFTGYNDQTGRFDRLVSVSVACPDGHRRFRDATPAEIRLFAIAQRRQYK